MGQQIRPMTYQDRYNKLKSEALISSHFSKEFLPDGFQEALRKALIHCSLFKTGAHYLTWKQMINPEREFFMAEMLLCLSILKGASPFEMNQTLEENIEMFENIINPLEEKYIEIEEEILKPIRNKVDAEAKISQNAPIGKKIIQG